MENFMCAGCPDELDDSQALQCHKCKQSIFHHVICTRISNQDFTEMSLEMKSLWICDACRCKQPRKGDHSNTPVRNTPVEMEFVTQRVKSRTTTCSCLSATNVCEIIREELRIILTNELLPKIQELKNTVASFEVALTSLNYDIEKVKSEQSTQSLQLSNLIKENENLRAANQTVTNRLMQLEQHTRAENIEIQCVPEHRQENLINTVQQLGKIICPVAEENIHFCARLSKMNTKSPRPRSILVKFNSPRLRDEFLAATIKYNKNNSTDKLNTSHLGIANTKKTPIYVVENLTPEGKLLHAAACRKVKELGFRFVWVRDGKIFVRKSEGSNYVCIYTKS